MWTKFSPREMGRRWSLARDFMRRHGLDGLLIFGHSGAHRRNQANVFWLTNHLDFHHSYLVIPARDDVEPALYIGFLNHLPQARQVCDLPIIEWGGRNPAEAVAQRLGAIRLADGRLGLVGPNPAFGMGMPYQHYLHLRATLPALDFVDVSAEFARMRTVKSQEEIEWLRRASRLTDTTIETLRHEARPGMTESGLVGMLENTCRRQGGMLHLAFLRSMPMDDPSGCVPAQEVSDRVIQRGDVLITEISACHWGYSGQIHRPIFVGADPTPIWRDLFTVALEAYRRLSAAMRPGASERDLVRAGSVIGERGYAIYDDLIHGYGVDIQPPLIDRSCCRHWPWHEGRVVPEGERLQAGMAIVIQPNPITPDERAGLQLGALAVVTDRGAETLNGVPFEPIVVGI